MIGYVLMALYIIACLVLILFVLLQPGKSDAAAVFGGGANSSAFGPRGTQTVMAKVTIGAAIAFFLIAFVFAEVPGLFEPKSVGGGLGSAPESAPAQPAAPVPVPAEQTPPAGEAPTVTQPAATETKPAAKPVAPAQRKEEPKPAEKKPPAKQP